MSLTNDPNDIDKAIANSQFTEYVRFEGNYKQRIREKHDFMAGIDNAPDYDYPYLQTLNVPDEEGNVLDDQKKRVYEASTTLTSQREAGLLNNVEYDLYATYLKRQLKKIMLVEVASRMKNSYGEPKVQQLAIKEDYMILNRQLYGDMDQELFNAILHSEQQRIKAFTPSNKRAAMIKRSLMSYFLTHEFSNAGSKFNFEILTDLHDFVRKRYQNVLAVVPNTAHDELFDAFASQNIMQTALEVGGLAHKGWRVEIDPAKSNPSTSASCKLISLPCDTVRTGAQLQRLIMHEQEVHARRAQNGEESGLSILQNGTAGYSSAEEGLGVLMECAVAGVLDNESYYRVHDRYMTAGLALGLDGRQKDSRATFSLLWRLIALRLAVSGVVFDKTVRKAKEMAMKLTENAFRGTNFLMPGIIYMKLKVYYEGFRKNIIFFEQHLNSLSEAFDSVMIGKYNHLDETETQAILKLVRHRS